MKYEELKHKIDSIGKFKLQWNWTPRKDDPAQFYFNRWLTFDSKEDATKFYEEMVKPFHEEDLKWEIIDV